MNKVLKILGLTFLIVSQLFNAFGRVVEGGVDIDLINISPVPVNVNDESIKRNTPSISIKWDKQSIEKKGGEYIFKIESQFPFTYFGIGWDAYSSGYNPEEFTIKYRFYAEDDFNSEWQTAFGEYHPEENISRLYRSDIIFTGVSGNNFKYEIKLIPPKGCDIQSVVLDFVKIENGNDFSYKWESKSVHKETEGCSMPTIIPRSEWCSVYADCQVPKYMPEKIYPTHVVLHHGASPDNYDDGYRVVKSYWDYHVNSLGWDDIGYNYLIDKYGNIFQGRYNPFDYTTDVKGAHSGSVNSKAIGVCFLGNSDITLATEEQLSRLEEFLSWWYNTKDIDPVSKENVINQAATDTLYLPRLVGHRDVKAATICPGESLYNMLPGIRTATRENLIECSGRKVTSDYFVENTYIEPIEILAGGELTINCTNIQKGKINQEDLSKTSVSVFISKDSIFSPVKDKLLFEASNIFESENISSSKLKQLITIDRRTTPGLYYVFFITDFKNNIWESNEFNNEEYITVNILDNSSLITVNSEPLNGGIVTGDGKYFNGDICFLTARDLFGFDFSGWYENDSLISENSELSFIVVEDRNISAKFVCSSSTEVAGISGESKACTGDKEFLYVLNNVPNGITYNWILPEGFTGSSNNDSILISFSKTAKSGMIVLEVDLGCNNEELKYNFEVEVLRRPDKPVLTIKGGAIFSNHDYDSTITYQWYKNSVFVNDYSNNYYLPQSDGFYYLIESNDNCYSFSSDQVIFLVDSLDSGEEQKPVLMFPNPVNEIVSVMVYKISNEEVEFAFYDTGLRHRFSYIKQAGIDYFTIDLSGLERGIYIVKYRIKNKVAYTKLMKR